MPPTESRPNILLIMSDEHDPAVSGCYGDGVVETPALDRLAAEGVTFDACYTTSPLCVPARLSFTAGKYISRCGAWSNNSRLPSPDYPSIARVLHTAGYETYLCGKQHYHKTRRYGFSDILPETFTNRYVKSGTGARRASDDTTVNAKSWAGRASAFHPGSESDVLDHDRAVTQRTCSFLEQWQAQQGPFFLFAGHLSPHFPLIAPDELYRKYRDRIPLPAVSEELINALPRNYKHLRYGFGVTECDTETLKKGRELYWALTDWYDRQIGQILHTLDDSEVGDNTIVVYTSDHGENKGDHGLWWKNNMFEHSARIPLIVRWPERWSGGQRRTQACSMVDLVQTLADIAGASCPEDWDGVSMLPWLEDPSHEWKDLAVSEYYAHNISSGMAMLRTGPWKYVYHTAADDTHGAERELYNLNADPRELSNLAAQPEHAERLRQLHAALVEEIGEDPEDTEQRCRAEYARGYADDADKQS